MKHADILIVFLCIVVMNSAYAQNRPSKPCSAPECRQMDFWVGEWKLTYNDTSEASNNITSDMGGCVIHEHFHDRANNYIGESWSAYTPIDKMWHQTWVDNQGAYIVLKGTYKDGEMVLRTEPALKNGIMTWYRMVYHNITGNSLDWEWEASTDEGKTWKSNWHIHYNRK